MKKLTPIDIAIDARRNDLADALYLTPKEAGRVVKLLLIPVAQEVVRKGLGKVAAIAMLRERTNDLNYFVYALQGLAQAVAFFQKHLPSGHVQDEDTFIDMVAEAQSQAA